MSWMINIKPEGDEKCADCKHLNFCNIVKVGPQLGPVLTSVDTCEDGHTAHGTATLECGGFESVPETVSDTDGVGQGQDGVDK